MFELILNSLTAQHKNLKIRKFSQINLANIWLKHRQKKEHTNIFILYC